MHPAMMHPRMREAMANNQGRPPPAAPLKTQILEEKQPGHRAMGFDPVVATGPSGVGTMGMIMPIYSIIIVLFFCYTIFKLLSRKSDGDENPSASPSPSSPRLHPTLHAYQNDIPFATRDRFSLCTPLHSPTASHLSSGNSTTCSSAVRSSQVNETNSTMLIENRRITHECCQESVNDNDREDDRKLRNRFRHEIPMMSSLSTPPCETGNSCCSPKSLSCDSNCHPDADVTSLGEWNVHYLLLLEPLTSSLCENSLCLRLMREQLVRKKLERAKALQCH